MLLKDFFQKLALSPVGDLSVGGDTSGTLPPASVPRMVAHLNTALVDLHTRFPLRKGSLMLTTLSSRNEYPLQRPFALTSGSAEADKFILDSMLKPFNGDVLGIDAVFDNNQCPLNLNVVDDRYGWHTVRFDVLTMGYPVTGELYTVQYRQRHPVIAANADPDTTEIQLPPSFEDSLVLKVAHLVFSGLTAETAVLKANELLQAYERSLMQNQESNVANTSTTDTREERFRRDGWV